MKLKSRIALLAFSSLLSSCFFDEEKGAALSSVASSSSALLSQSSAAVSSSAVVPVPPVDKAYRIGYLMNDAPAELAKIDWSQYTHVMVFSGLAPQDDGSIYRYKTYGNVPLGTIWAAGSNFRDLYHPKFKEAGGKTLLVVGGWGDQITASFSATCANDEYRKNMIDQLSELMNGSLVQADGTIKQIEPLDGVDFDWEYPRTTADKQCFTKMMTEMRAKAPDKLITAAVYEYPTYYEASKLAQVLDWIAIMSYDDITPGKPEHSSYTIATKAAGKWHAAGVPYAKLAMGIAMYGYINDSQTPWNQVYQDTTKWKYFTSQDSTRLKANFIADSGMRGAMYWEISQDVYGDPLSISKQIADQLKAKGK